MLEGRSKQAFLSESPRIGPYLTLLRGVASEQENIRWAEFTLSVIRRRSTSTDDGADAGRLTQQIRGDLVGRLPVVALGLLRTNGFPLRSCPPVS
ncbi:hypothetical protein [Nocardia asiatica]|uniref:hypothetical protein n=1 Tax=Nocardia asiatica TaxID=209252 RepID=UPI003EE1896C